jgi:hypothetical protein
MSMSDYGSTKEQRQMDALTDQVWMIRRDILVLFKALGLPYKQCAICEWAERHLEWGWACEIVPGSAKIHDARRLPLDEICDIPNGFKELKGLTHDC